MNDRDRLVELICTALGKELEKNKIFDFPVIEEAIADHLIANGVIVPPCKVGVTVYVIEPCYCYSDCANRYINICNKLKSKCLAIVQLSRCRHKQQYKCLKLFERPFRIEYLSKIGKTVFLTREEAEKKLEEMRK